MEKGLEQLVGKDSKAEGINLVRKIESHTEDLLQSLNSIEELIDILNESLLPPMPTKTESEAKDQRPSQGWLEYHSSELNALLQLSRQIHSKIARLTQATKIEK